MTAAEAVPPRKRHIIDALNTGPRRRIAVSVFPKNPNEIVAEKARILNLLTEHDVLFFDSMTHPPGDPALHIA
jgi:hypothetical protein